MRYVFDSRPPVWANFQQRALDVAILEINTKTDLKVKVASFKASPGRRTEVHDQVSSDTERGNALR
jgi:hypothetical protein